MSDLKTAEPERRGPAIAGGLAGVAVIALLAVVFLFVRTGGDETPAAETPLPTPSAAAQDGAEAPPQTPSEPARALDPRLREKPAVEAGRGKLTKLTVTPLVRGTGPKVEAGQRITVNYVGVTYPDGQEFDSSWARNEPLQTPIGAGQLIPGWDRGLVGVPVGSRVRLDIPSDLAYGDDPAGGQPAGDLRFVVDILDVA